MSVNHLENRSDSPGSPDSPIDRYREQWLRSALKVAAIVAVVLAACWESGVLNPVVLAEGLPALGALFADAIPPDFARWQEWIVPVYDTLIMSIAGTAFAVVFSVPIAFLAAENTSPNRLVYHVSRTVLNALRAVPELIMGIIFVAAVGFGVLPGVLAVGLHSIGMVGKFYAEAIEHVDDAPVEATRAAGCSGLQTICFGILPQVLPQFADVSIYRWEYNFRASTVMGMVGAGGIGFELMSALKVMDYQQGMAVMLVVLVMVTIVDSISGVIRRRFK